MIYKSDKIKCKKGHIIFTAKEDIDFGDCVSQETVDFEKTQQYVGGEISDCKICGSIWFGPTYFPFIERYEQNKFP